MTLYLDEEGFGQIVAEMRANLAVLNERIEKAGIKRDPILGGRYVYESSLFSDGPYQAFMVFNRWNNRENVGVAWDKETGKLVRIEWIRRGGGGHTVKWSAGLKRWAKLAGKSVPEIVCGLGLLDLNGARKLEITGGAT